LFFLLPNQTHAATILKGSKGGVVVESLCGIIDSLFTVFENLTVGGRPSYNIQLTQDFSIHSFCH
jgi:hypothetical protein